MSQFLGERLAQVEGVVEIGCVELQRVELTDAMVAVRDLLDGRK